MQNEETEPTPGAAVPEPFPELTERERAVAMAIIRGLTGREIAEAMGISLKTYDTHRGHVLKKLGCANVVKLVLLALERNFIGPLSAPEAL
jgi:DNA-binding NarL/FixJ family response regulator